MSNVRLVEEYTDPRAATVEYQFAAEPYKGRDYGKIKISINAKDYETGYEAINDAKAKAQALYDNFCEQIDAQLQQQEDHKQIVDIINEREGTHGSFEIVSFVASGIKSCYRAGANYDNLTIAQREALDMIAVKLSRIVCGNGKHEDHWDDIGGYAELGSRSCNDPKQGKLDL